MKEKTHYIAPPHDALSDEMHTLLDYINHSKDNPYVKSAIAHLWFVIIHSYDDGNGRITRTIANYVFSKGLGLNHKYFSISSAVIKDKKNY